MKTCLVFLAMIISPTLVDAQHNDLTVKTAFNNSYEKVIKLSAKKKTERISTNPIEQTNLNFKKSNDLISVKAYIRSLQIKGDTILNS